jgi:hypothetical protein
MKAIAHAYWRQIKRGTKTFESIPSTVKDDVKTLAKADVADGLITEEDYKSYIGEEYVA